MICRGQVQVGCSGSVLVGIVEGRVLGRLRSLTTRTTGLAPLGFKDIDFRSGSAYVDVRTGVIFARARASPSTNQLDQRLGKSIRRGETTYERRWPGRYDNTPPVLVLPDV